MKRNPHIRTAFSTVPPDLRQAMDDEDWTAALQIASKFSILGSQKEAITRAWQAHTRPDFYRSIGKDPATLIAAGIAALKERYAA